MANHNNDKVSAPHHPASIKSVTSTCLLNVVTSAARAYRILRRKLSRKYIPVDEAIAEHPMGLALYSVWAKESRAG